MADDDHPKSQESKKRHSIASAPAEDARSHRMSASELPSGQLGSPRRSRASEPAPVSSPIAINDDAEASEKHLSVVHPTEEETAPQPQSPKAQSEAIPPKSPATHSIKSPPKSPGAQSIKTIPKSPRQSVASQPKSLGKQSVVSALKSPGRQSATAPPKSSGKQSVTAPPKSPAAQSVKAPTISPKSPGAQSVKSTPKSPGRQSVASQPKSPEKQSVISAPKSPGRQSVTAPPKSPGKQSITAPKSPEKVSVTSVPKSPGVPQAVSVPKSPGKQSTVAPSVVASVRAPSIAPSEKAQSVVAPSTIAPAVAPSAVTPAAAPSVTAPPKSPEKQPSVALSTPPVIQPLAEETVPPAQVPEVTSIAPDTQQLQPTVVPTAPQIIEQVTPSVASLPPYEPAQIAPAAIEPSEYVESQVVSAVEGEEIAEPAEETLQMEKEAEESQEIEKQELVVKDVLYEITGLESLSFQGYMGSLTEFLCTQCKTAVYMYWKTPCNHQFCEKCKSGAVSDEFFTCLVEGTQINITELVEVVSDLDKLKDAEVFCLNKAQGCKEKYPIKDIKDHLEDCYYTFFPCPQNCGEAAIRKDLGKHLTEDCERRVYLCDMCETDVQEVQRTVHDEVCEKKPPPINCEFCGMGPIEGSDMELHYQDCVQKPRPCRMASIGCTFVGTKEEADCHENFDNHRELIMAFIKDQKETVSNLEQEKNQTKLQLSEALGKLQNIDLINRYLAVKVGILEEVPYVQKEMEEENRFLKGKVEDLLNKQLTHEEQISRMTEYCAGRPFEWTIKEYLKKKQAEIDEGGRQCSPPFYISYAGYRVRLVAYLNGNGEGKGTHLALYFCLMKGANDAVLDWPLKQKVTLRLVDRKFGTPLLKKVVEPKSFTLSDDSFQRPVFEENVGRGYPKFISHEELEAVDSRYLLKDSIIIAAEFEPAEITE